MIIDGSAIALEAQTSIQKHLEQNHKRKPCLAVILVGTHAPSQIYVKRKTQACTSVGILSLKIELPESISESSLIGHIHALNHDAAVDGILVQLPLPHHIDAAKITLAIDPQKDVDGFHPVNIGKMLLGQSDGFIPCTPLGIQFMIEKLGIETKGKQALVIGRSNIVGKPMAALLMQSSKTGNATVTVANSFTKNIEHLSLAADILIAAMGRPHFITCEMVKEGAAVFDVGINRIHDSKSPSGFKIVGDVDFENVKDKCSYITPVPGGVGPMTIAMLLQNTFTSYCKRERITI